ncbi:MAG: ytvI [Bacillales bacterium]|nr:ytvI [Bacillales bacterium]
MSRNFVYGLVRFVFVLFCAVAGLYLTYHIASLTYPFIIGLVLAYVINPLVRFIEKGIRLPRGFSVFVSILIVFGALIAILTILISELISGIDYLLLIVPTKFAHLVNMVEVYFTSSILPWYEGIATKFDRLDHNSQSTIIENVKAISQNLAEQGQHLLRAILLGITATITYLPNIVTTLVFSMLATFFISKDWDRLKNLTDNLMPERAKDGSKVVSTNLQFALIGFVKAQLTLITYTAVIVLLGLLILRVPYAITLAVIIGVVDLLPYLGTGFVFVPWIVYLFFTGDTSLAVWLLGLYGIVLIQRQIMEPRVMASSIGLDPLATLIAVFVGFQLFGFIGLMVGPLFLVIINALWDAKVLQDIWYFIKGEKAI